MNKMIVMCGLPRSGKSTWIKKNIILKNLVMNKVEFFNITKMINIVMEKNDKNAYKEKTHRFFNIVKDVFEDILNKYNITINTYCDYSFEFSSNKYVIVSADDIRESVHNKEYIACFEPMIQAIREYILIYILKKGYNVVIDETNLTIERRKNIFNLVKKYGKKYSVKCVVIDTPLDVVLERTEFDDFKETIKRKYKESTIPMKKEGFDEIIF
jgi:predicted kinase